jgi:hypothetical protein
MSPLSQYDAAAFAKISQEMLAQPVVEETLQKVVDGAVDTIQGVATSPAFRCDAAGQWTPRRRRTRS